MSLKNGSGPNFDCNAASLCAADIKFEILAHARFEQGTPKPTCLLGDKINELLRIINKSKIKNFKNILNKGFQNPTLNSKFF